MAVRSAIDCLRAIAARCESGELGEDGLWLAQRLRNYFGLASRGASLDLCLDLAPPPGGEPWWRTEARARRDTALRQLAEECSPDLSISEQAAQIAEWSLRYSATAWRFDQHRDAPPDSYRGTPRWWLWHALKDGKVPGPEMVRKILSRADELVTRCPIFITRTSADTDSCDLHIGDATIEGNSHDIGFGSDGRITGHAASS
jgi:hypothetical protein